MRPMNIFYSFFDRSAFVRFQVRQRPEAARDEGVLRGQARSRNRRKLPENFSRVGGEQRQVHPDLLRGHQDLAECQRSALS